MQTETTPAEAEPTIAFLIDQYLDAKDGKHGAKPCKSALQIRSHLKPVRERWGDVTLKDFCKRSKALVREALSDWRTPTKDLPDGLGPTTIKTRLSLFKTARTY